MRSLVVLLPLIALLSACVTDSGTNRAGLYGEFFFTRDNISGTTSLSGTYDKFAKHLDLVIDDPAATTLILFNHGTEHSGQGQVCRPKDDIPEVYDSIVERSSSVVLFYACSNEIEGSQARNLSQDLAMKRALETERLVDAFIDHGVELRNIVLAGHSGGATASLVAATLVSDRSAGFIVFAPGTGYAYLGRPINDTWYSTHYYRWKNMIEAGQHMRGLVFAFEDDKYAPIDELEFVGDIPNVKLITVGRPTCSEGWIPHFFGYTRCFRNKYQQTIVETIQRWSESGTMSASSE